MAILHMFATPNCWKASIMLEEAGMDYSVNWINLRERENMSDAYRAKAPFGKVPCLEDDGNNVYGSGAIILYVAEKAGKLMPAAGAARAEALDWFMYATTDLTNSWVYRNRFRNMLPEKDEYAIGLFEADHARALGHAEDRLGTNEYLCGDAITIADIAAFPQVGGPLRDGELLKDYPNLVRWADTLEARPRVQKGLITSG